MNKKRNNLRNKKSFSNIVSDNLSVEISKEHAVDLSPEEQELSDIDNDLNSEPVDSLGTAYCKDIRPFIDVIDNLRRFGLQQDVSLPNVVVVGDQSSGKSSIIEAISGIQLPRGKGIVTRCPLELQLKRVENKPWKATLSYKSFNGTSERLDIDDPSTVESRIVEAQVKMCGTDNGVSNNLITLRVESPAKTAPDLTLIDLPSIARIAVEGQPYDICDQIQKIIKEHVQHKNTVILCVVSANLDAAVNESINISKKYDPNGLRTFGVITKPDMADEAQKEDVIGLLNNEKIFLEKGYHMVKCRSQQELTEGLSLEKSIKLEEKFFKEDNTFKSISPSKLGTMNLALKITEELVGAIKATLSGLRDIIDTSLQECLQKLCKLPQSIPDNVPGKWIYLLGKINQVNSEIEITLQKGKIQYGRKNLFCNWRNIFNALKQKMDSIKDDALKKNFTIEKLDEEISLKRGNEVCGFLNFELFESLIIDHVILYKYEAEKSLELVWRETYEIIRNIIKETFRHIPQVEEDLNVIAYKQLELAKQKTTKRLTRIFNEEKHVFTLDSSFERELDIMNKSNKIIEKNKNNITEEENSEINYNLESSKEDPKRMQSIILCYLKIVHCRLSDNIPMAFRQYLHIEMCDKLRLAFSNYGITPDVAHKVKENKAINDNRNALNDKIKRLQMAKEELAKVN